MSIIENKVENGMPLRDVMSSIDDDIVSQGGCTISILQFDDGQWGPTYNFKSGLEASFVEAGFESLNDVMEAIMVAHIAGSRKNRTVQSKGYLNPASPNNDGEPVLLEIKETHH